MRFFVCNRVSDQSCTRNLGIFVLRRKKRGRGECADWLTTASDAAARGTPTGAQARDNVASGDAGPTQASLWVPQAELGSALPPLAVGSVHLLRTRSATLALNPSPHGTPLPSTSADGFASPLALSPSSARGGDRAQPTAWRAQSTAELPSPNPAMPSQSSKPRPGPRPGPRTAPRPGQANTEEKEEGGCLSRWPKRERAAQRGAYRARDERDFLVFTLLTSLRPCARRHYKSSRTPGTPPTLARVVTSYLPPLGCSRSTRSSSRLQLRRRRRSPPAMEK
jgi:hypothetical protein